MLKYFFRNLVRISSSFLLWSFEITAMQIYINYNGRLRGHTCNLHLGYLIIYFTLLTNILQNFLITLGVTFVLLAATCLWLANLITLVKDLNSEIEILSEACANNDFNCDSKHPKFLQCYFSTVSYEKPYTNNYRCITTVSRIMLEILLQML